MSEQAPLVLLVDDDFAMRRLLGTVLRSAGYEVAEASDGQEALALMAQRPQLVVVDFMMPVMDGEEFLTAARLDGYDGPAVFVSARGGLQVKASKLRADYLTKPFASEELLEKVRVLLAPRVCEVTGTT